ncbi:SDR family NAD(P)-dependent oxidoreductase [Kineococcus sp. LSe6-4]|uniref:SDR family NAD(P)-dependent oxidoreductase n=1 Tax=Kineococcus halophytocola TaxID=3234027 RepID=A0ABV4H5Y3_9ACTN
MSTWFITGTSRGLGRELVTQLLARGEHVTATTRSTERLTAALSDVDTSRLLPLELDLTDEAAVTQAVEQTRERFGRIDVVVNNAGYGFLGAVEETSDADVRAMLDVQVVGVWNVLRAVLPILRTQRSGHVINISSILGLTSFPGWALYCAGKFALEGLTESLAAEVADLGIAVSLVEPGYFRTDFLTSNSLVLPEETTDAYPALREMTQAHLQMAGTQLGDPAKGAAALIDLAGAGNGGRLRHLLGSDAHTIAVSALQTRRAEVEAGEQVARSTDVVTA